MHTPAVSFLAPLHLIALVPVAGVVLAAVVIARRRVRAFRSFADPHLADWVTPRRPGWRRAVTMGGFGVVLTVLVLAWARPAHTVLVTYRLRTVIVVMDVSSSMAARDVKPLRLRAAQGAASTFVRQIPDGIQVGLVIFSDQAAISLLPTEDRDAVVRAILATKADGATAIGEAIFKSLDAIAAERGLTTTTANGAVRYPILRASAVVLLSDGSTNQGRPNSLATAAARLAKVPVSTIAFGTDDGTIGQGDEQIAVPVDAEALRTIATLTSGHAYRATSADELRHVYSNLGSEIVYRPQEREITGWFVGAAIAAAGLTALGSVVWFGRIP